MWRPLDFKDYILKKENFQGGWVIYISDFVHIWSRTLKNEDIIAIFKEKNPLIEAEFNDKLIKRVISLFDGQVNKKKVEKHGDKLLIELESDLSGVRFYFNLELNQLEPDKTFKDITLPFMLLAAKLKIRENKLVDVIKKKDAEITEYKQENAVIKRSHLITKEFCFDEFTKEELEETCSSLSKIRKSPSLILDLINAKILDSSVKNSLQGNDVCEIKNQNNSDSVADNPHVKKNSKNVSNNKRDLQSSTKHIRKTKSKLEVQINACAKRRKENFAVPLKF